MTHLLKCAALAFAAVALMGFDSADPWAGLEGEWAAGSLDHCGGVNTLVFTYDYPRDRYGDLIYPNDQPPRRRNRFATTYVNGDRQDLVNVGDQVSMSGNSINLNIRRPSFLPFRGWSDLSLAITDENTLTEQSSSGDGDRLMRTMGAAPVELMRCPAREE